MKLSRRSVLGSIAVAPSTYLAAWGNKFLSWSRALAGPVTRSQNTAPLSIHEITMTAPDIIRVEVRDGEIIKGPLVGPLKEPDTASYNHFVERTNPHSGRRELAQVVSQNKTYLKFMDQAATRYLDRASADDASGYGQIGDCKVVHVYRRSEPYDYGQVVGSNGGLASATSMRHYLFLKLDKPLGSGAHQISFPSGTTLATTAFHFNDKATRASSIKTTQVGHRPGDVIKNGYLSQWVPGISDEGAIDFQATYGLDTFDVIDEQGHTHFSGRIAKRIGPRDIEERSGWPHNIRYASLNHPPKVIQSIARGTPGVFTSPDHGFTDGEFVILRGIGGIPQLEGRSFTIANATPDTFSLRTDKGKDISTTSLPRFRPTAYLRRFSGLVYATYTANRAATYVFGLDYSGWKNPAPGRYRIHIAGLGVSDPFRIDESVWYDVARNAAAGEYHQRNGLALDGRFGYTRGVTFRDGENGTKIYWSRLPALFSSEWGLIPQPIRSNDGANPATWLTSHRATGWYGGTMDAGDWDECTYQHIPTYYWLLDLGYEKLPPKSRDINFGLPKSSEVLDRDLYAGTDTLPDAIHQAIWYLDAYRRLQRQDGAVGAGLGFAGGGAGASFEASPICRLQAYIYAADPASNFTYALGAAKLAIIFEGAGFKRLATIWSASAEAAWRWAEALYQSMNSDGALRDAYFLGELNLKRNAGWDNKKYQDAMTRLKRLVPNRRIAAAGALFRLTSAAAYRKVVEECINKGYYIAGDAGMGLWEYVLAAKADPRLRSRVQNAGGGFGQRARTSIETYMRGHIGYKNLSSASNSWIGNGGPYPQVLQAYLTIGAHEFLGLLQDGLAVTLGANQTGFCYTNGIGYRTLERTTLHLDTRYLGLKEAPAGITHYGWDQPGILLRVFNFSTDAPLNFTAETPTGHFEADYGTTKIYEPYRLSMPFAEQTVPNPFIIYHMEYTFHQTIVPQQIMAMWLHCWDGNTTTGAEKRQPAH